MKPKVTQQKDRGRLKSKYVYSITANACPITQVSLHFSFDPLLEPGPDPHTLEQYFTAKAACKASDGPVSPLYG